MLEWRRRARAAAVAAALVAGLAVEGTWAGATPSPSGAPARPGAPASVTRRTVAMYDDYFQPRRIRIPRGARVRWVNRGEVPHTTTGRRWDVTLEPGESWGRRFRRAGTYRYVCRFHDGMTGRIIVVG